MTSKNKRSYLWVDDLSTDETLALFARAEQIKKTLHSGQPVNTLGGKQISVLFSEASTRTKMSFQMAAQRLGGQCLVFDNINTSSMIKGETFEDTFWTLNAMRPDLFIIRCRDSEPLEKIADQSSIPIINAGFGSKGHPTQALLDVFTMKNHFTELAGLRVLYVGDIAHSRVAHSGIMLLQALGAEVKVCAPEVLSKNASLEVENFSSHVEAIRWAQVYVGLRVQFERHESNNNFLKEQFINDFSLSHHKLNSLAKDAVIMHPGPVNWGVEFQDCVRADNRLQMWKQKENGVYVRSALMEKILGVSQ